MYKMSKWKIEQYLENKKLVIEYFQKIIEKLYDAKIEFSPHSIKDGKITTIYCGEKRISTHKKKNNFYNMENGILISMRNVNKNNINADINKILDYIKS